MRPQLKTAATDLAFLLGQAEQKFAETVDTMQVKAHLAAMEARDFGDELVAKLDKLQLRATRLRAAAEGDAANLLQRVSDACVKLKAEIQH